MLSPRLTVTFDAHEPARLAQFWAGMLGRDIVEDAYGVSLPGTDTQVGLRFAAGSAAQARPDHLHLHLTSAEPVDQQRTVATALGLGAAHLDVGQRPEEGHIVLADPEGNPFCVIEHGNAYLAGCGLLGEITCDGTRKVGLFWSAVLGWPLVWDQDEETAIQSPYGGTKVAWGGPPLAVRTEPVRQRFDLTTTGGDRPAEVDRLVALGATRLTAGGTGPVLLADPDGTEFRLVTPEDR
ncbi:VOC family protein [Actinoplanes sp. DH11]|uniref:VOC family protein n=1 Tax=Actinoplanes sp. DH11 TaxID=2857011 RepID=UPI001E49CA35|nr:VOC family protein [Actinoplanes sp. DH11]